jgi:Tfp pilus assembly protein PilV
MVLMEVVIALVVFTMAAFALVAALSASFDAADNRNQIDIAVRGLQNQMALLHGTRLSPGETDAPDDGTGVLYHVSVTQEQLKDQKGNSVPNMYRATITAAWKAKGQTETRDVSELIFQP